MAEHSCHHSWCIAARTGAMCDCPFAQMFPHRVRDCTRRGTVTVIGHYGQPTGREGGR